MLRHPTRSSAGAAPATALVTETVTAEDSGYVDDGCKDTVLVMAGEKARILMRYVDYRGFFLYHGHNVEHEDGGMMCDIAVES